MKKPLLLFLMVSSLLISCSDDGIETNVPVISDADKTVNVILTNIPDGFLGENVYVFTLNNKSEVYAVEGATAEEDAIVAIQPPTGNAPFDIVVFIPSDADWLTIDSFNEGNYSVMTAATDRSAVYVATSWENEDELDDTSMTGVQTTILVDISLDGETEPLSTEYDQGDLIVLNASVTDNINSDVTNLSYSLDGTNLITYNEKPYSFVFNTVDVSDGEHILSVMVTNDEGHTAEDEISIQVNSSANEAPSVDIGITNNTTIIHQTVQVIAPTISGTDITKVEFRIEGDLVETLTEEPYTYDWNTLDNDVGTVTIMVTAYDATGASRSDVVNVILEAPANYNPVVNITSPSDGANITAGTIITISASVSDVENDITGADFYFNGGYIGTVSSAPFSGTFDTTGYSAGAYTIEVQAFDGSGGSGSDQITININ